MQSLGAQEQLKKDENNYQRGKTIVNQKQPKNSHVA
jgi:hypothetical protein